MRRSSCTQTSSSKLSFCLFSRKRKWEQMSILCKVCIMHQPSTLPWARIGKGKSLCKQLQAWPTILGGWPSQVLPQDQVPHMPNSAGTSHVRRKSTGDQVLHQWIVAVPNLKQYCHMIFQECQAFISAVCLERDRDTIINDLHHNLKLMRIRFHCTNSKPASITLRTRWRRLPSSLARMHQPLCKRRDHGLMHWKKRRW